MTRLRKTNRFNYILPLMVIGLLFSIAISVFSAEYIGSIICELNDTDLTEKLTLNLYTDPQLFTFNRAVRIYTGGPYGLPRGLVAAAISAQVQRTPIDITTEYLNATPEDFDRVVGIYQTEAPDDISSLFSGLDLGDIDRMVGDISGELAAQYPKLGNILTQNNNIDNTVDIINNLTVTQTVSLNNDIYYGQTFDLYTRANNFYGVVNGQTPTIATLSSKLDSVYSITNSAYNSIGSFDANVTSDWYYLTSKSGLINTKLNQKDTLLQNIWNTVNR